ncbi:unnamed protein product [Dibothriocephalus latus]|uniref:Uncharacterized protein n=1 Tax=Dibothriocephalus latus TaxID=60516 RepID=A0A3P7NN04_DIBLA|nr:unnamed protein product [Dibothriocephalus latus]
MLGRWRVLTRPAFLPHRRCLHSPACDVDCLADANFVSSMRRNIKERCVAVNLDEMVSVSNRVDPAMHTLSTFALLKFKNIKERCAAADIDEMLLLYDRYRGGDHSLLPRLRELCLSLPNFSHPNSPVGDPSKTRLLRLNGSPKPTAFPPKDAVTLLSNEILPDPRKRRRLRGLGLLRCHDMVPGCGHRSYNFYGSLALLETALVTFALDRITGAGMQQLSVPDILPASAIESCGFPTTGERTQIFIIDDGATGSKRFCLSGTAEMAIATFCAGRTFSPKSPAEYFCAASRCYRHEVSNQESLLYRTHQFTKARTTFHSFPQL